MDSTVLCTEIKVRVDSLRKQSDAVIVIAIDGRAASGKTTFAEKLSSVLSAGVVHLDDFFLPPKLKTSQRLSTPGGNINYERFIHDALPYIRDPRPFSYPVYDCRVDEIHESRTVPAGTVRIVEGVYSFHPAFGNYADIKLFIDIDAAEQKNRIHRRNGEPLEYKFLHEWIPLEEHYFAALSVSAAADRIYTL
ncbi:MAG: hypothetical protein LKF96_03110 [Treponema sp.]|jgi:uridine kinase|nr:hypothetical protein [Treponema sp.]